jgi:hypothetical protein
MSAACLPRLDLAQTSRLVARAESAACVQVTTSVNWQRLIRHGCRHGSCNRNRAVANVIASDLSRTGSSVTRRRAQAGKCFASGQLHVTAPSRAPSSGSLDQVPPQARPPKTVSIRRHAARGTHSWVSPRSGRRSEVPLAVSSVMIKRSRLDRAPAIKPVTIHAFGWRLERSAAHLSLRAPLIISAAYVDATRRL